MIRKLEKIGLLNKIFNIKKKYMKIRFEVKLGNIKNTSKIKEIKKNIAKIMTKINRKVKLKDV